MISGYGTQLSFKKSRILRTNVQVFVCVNTETEVCGQLVFFVLDVIDQAVEIRIRAAARNAFYVHIQDVCKTMLLCE